MARKRRSREQTRAEILEAAETRLRDAGPDSLRLDDVAAEVGISRQAVLHHFGSRAGLLRAVVERAWTGLFADLSNLADSASLGPWEFVELVDDVARRKGHARLGAWLLLSEQGLPDAVFDRAATALPGRIAAGDPREAAYTTLLLAATLFGDALFGRRLRQVLGLPDTEEARADFRAWLAARLPPTRPPN